MSDDGVSLNLDVTDGLSPAIAKLASKVAHLEPALDEIGASLVTSTQHRFEEQKGPDGKKWKPLAASTLAKRGTTARILRDKGELFDSVTHTVRGSEEVAVGTNKKYARRQQLGWPEKPETPARPYLGLSKADVKEVEAILADHVGVSP